MKHTLIYFATIVLFLSSGKKELQPMPEIKSINTETMLYNTPPPPGSCEGNSWDYDPGTTIWNSSASVPGATTATCAASVIDGKADCGVGYSPDEQEKDYYDDF